MVCSFMRPGDLRCGGATVNIYRKRQGAAACRQEPDEGKTPVHGSCQNRSSNSCKGRKGPLVFPSGHEGYDTACAQGRRCFFMGKPSQRRVLLDTGRAQISVAPVCAPVPKGPPAQIQAHCICATDAHHVARPTFTADRRAISCLRLDSCANLIRRRSSTVLFALGDIC